MCSSDLIGAYGGKASPFEAKFYRKDCGATARFSYELFLKKKDNSNETLVLRFDDNGNRSWPDNEKTLIHMRLVKPNQLHVRLLQAVRIFRQEDAALGLKVIYDYPSGTIIM